MTTWARLKILDWSLHVYGKDKWILWTVIIRHWPVLYGSLWSQFLSNHMRQTQGTWLKFTSREGQVNTGNCNCLTLTYIVWFTELWSQFLSNHMGQAHGTGLIFAFREGQQNTVQSNCWIDHLFKSTTCVKAPALNIPNQFLYYFVLYKSATFTWAPSACKFIPKTQIVLQMMATYYL